MWSNKSEFNISREPVGTMGNRQYGEHPGERRSAPDQTPTVPFRQDNSIEPTLLRFFGLRQQPFGVTPDPSFLYSSRTHREALASLVYGIETGRGFHALIAKPGMGKTTLLFHLLEKFRHSARSAFLFQTQCNSREFMQFLISELGFRTDEQDFVRMHEEFNGHLMREARAGKRFIVVVDEAQNLDPSVLETVRLLSNFETPRAKLLQIVLSGQPELAEKLASPEMLQLRQRLSFLNKLEPLTGDEIEQYIQHRMRVSGYAGKSLLTFEALTLLVDFSEGIPRNINNFCFNALSLAFALNTRTIDGNIAREVIGDLDISRHLSGTRTTSPAPVVSSQLAKDAPAIPHNFVVPTPIHIVPTNGSQPVTPAVAEAIETVAPVPVLEHVLSTPKQSTMEPIAANGAGVLQPLEQNHTESAPISVEPAIPEKPVTVEPMIAENSITAETAGSEKLTPKSDEKVVPASAESSEPILSEKSNGHAAKLPVIAEIVGPKVSEVRVAAAPIPVAASDSNGSQPSAVTKSESAPAAKPASPKSEAAPLKVHVVTPDSPVHADPPSNMTLAESVAYMNQLTRSLKGARS